MLRLSACAGVVSLLLLEVSLSAAATDWKALARKGSGEVVTVLEVGGGDDYDESDPVFIRPIDIVVAPDRSFYVLDYDGCVVQFSEGGAELRRFGQKGEGPGEFANPTRIGVDAAGRVFVSDFGNRRLSVFESGGRFLDSRPVQETVSSMEVCPDGAIFMLAEPVEMRVAVGAPVLTELIRIDAGLAQSVVLDSLRARSVHVVAASGGNITTMTLPFRTEMKMCALADGAIAYGRNDQYDIRVLAGDGRPVRHLARNIERRAVTSQDREKWFEGTSADERQRLRNIEFPKYVPVIEELFSDGPFLIVQREGPTLDVFEGDRFLGEVSVPDFRRPKAVREGRLFRPQYSKQHLPSVVMYSIR